MSQGLLPDAHVEQLYAAVVADVLDERGLRHQSLAPGIAPLGADQRLFGRALTVLAADTFEEPAEPYRRELEAVDALRDGDVLVSTVLGAGECGFWGELLSVAALSRGARGAIIDGYTRDSQAIRALDFPLFARGCCPLDSKGRSDVISYGTPIDCGGVRVHTGDYVFGDADGVVVIPGAIVEEVLTDALAKVSAESEMRKALRAGMGVIDAYERYGVL